MRILKCFFPMAVLGLSMVLLPGCKTAASQADSSQAEFATPETAATALQEALKADNQEAMQTLFGREWVEATASGDPVADQHDREVVALAMNQSWRWEPRGENARELIIGNENWPFPVPLVKSVSGWQFDSEAGREEVLSRRIGGNELGVISICADYVRAQWEYAGQPHDGKPAGLFAQRFRSTPGRQDGLYWGRQRWEKAGPLDDLVKAAVAEGYDPNKPDASPFRGYRFRIITAQGPAAPGGKKNYFVDGDMSGGFALVAYPVEYALSGVMTFVVGSDGIVYEKDLGPDTGSVAPLLMEYNPDESWTKVQ